MILSKKYELALLLFFASFGNICGSIVNWYLGKKILIFKSKKWLEHFYGFYFDEPMRSAVLFYKEVSKFKPDYYVDHYKDSPWIHMPFEKYEEKGIIEKIKKESLK